MQTAPFPLVTPVQLGAELRAARKAGGITQAALARHLGLSQSRVSFLELNPQHLSVEQLFVWCAVVGLELHIGLRTPAASLSGSSAAGLAAEVEW